MKDCPSCGASVPDSAAQCPSCRHEFEEEEQESDAGRTMLGLPAEEVPSEDAAEQDEEGEETDESGGREAHSTQFGMPTPDDTPDSGGGPEIDPSASGPDESAQDWSDLDPDEPDDEAEEGGGRDERSTHFGMPTPDDTPDSGGGPEIDPSAEGPEEEAQDWSDLDPGDTDEQEETDEERDARSTQFGLPSSDEDAVSPEQAEEHTPEADQETDADWSDLNEAAADEPEEGSILSAWGVDDESSPTRNSDARREASDSDRRAPPPEQQESEGRDSHETHMGMPRFDPDRVDEEEDESGDGELGDEDTAPGGPHESVEADPAPESGGDSEGRDVDSLDELSEDEDATRQIDIDSLKEQVAELDEEEEESGAAEGVGARSPDEQPDDMRDTSPGSQVVQGAADAPEESGGGEEDVDPSSTFHGKAGKALGGGFREPEQPDQSSEVVDESDGAPTPGAADAPETTPEEVSDEDEGRSRRETMGGLPGDDALVPGGEEPADDEPDADDEEAEASPRSTRLGQSIAAGSEESEGEQPRAEEQTSGDDEDEGGFSLPSPGEVGGGADTGAGPEGDVESDEQETPAAHEEERHRDAESDEAAGGAVPSPSAEVPSESAEEPEKLDEGTVPEAGAQSSDAGAEMELDLSEESAPDNFFEEIEEDVASELEEQELEEVDFGEESEPGEEEFAFDEEAGFEVEAEEPAGEPEAPPEEPAARGNEPESPEPEDATGRDDRPEPVDDGEPEAPPPDGGERSAPAGAEPAEGESVEAPPVSDLPEASGGGAAQSVIGVVAGLTLVSFLGVQTVSSGLFGHYLVLSLTLASGLGAAASFVTPFVGSNSQTKSMIYLGFGVVIGALAVAVVVMVTKELALGPILALSGATLAIGAGLVPAME